MVDNVKYLGSIIDNNLTINPQIDRIEGQVSRGLGVIYSLSNFCTSDILLELIV